jgi:2-hydroxychromene-2-carboxylate isomerase
MVSSKDTDMTTAEFHFDFGSPNAYLAHKVLPEIERRTGASFTYVPVLLGGVFKLTGNVSPMVSNNGIKNKAAYQRLESARFIVKHDLKKFQWNPHFPVNTLAIMRGAVAADMDGRLKPYADAVFRHMWEDGLKMDDVAVVRTALTTDGLDVDQIFARSQAADVKERLVKSTEASVARGSFGSPTFFVGDQMFFGKDRLADVEAEILRQRST